MENLRTQVFIQPGEEGRTVLPYSEVCMHMQVAGKPYRFRLLSSKYQPVFQILNEDGTDFSFPILYSEGGVYRDGDGRYYYYPAPE